MGKMQKIFGIVLGVLFCLVSTVLPAAAAPRALLIGIGIYKHLPHITAKGEKLNHLRGPGNDVQKLKELLVSGYNFSSDNIMVLKDQEATREAILKNFNQWLVRGTRPGDMVLFYYSGHGTRVPRGANGFLKALCPHDTLLKARNIQTARLIPDDELGDLFKKLKGRELVVIVDSCHSGGMTRSVRGISVIQLEQTPAVQSKFLPVEITESDDLENTRGVGLSSKSYDGPEDRISFASSREDQISVEMAFSSGMIHGAFTAALLEGIETKKDISYGEWFEQAKKTVKDKFRLEQDPQLKTNKGKLLTHTVFKLNPAESPVSNFQKSQGEKTSALPSSRPSAKPKPHSQSTSGKTLILSSPEPASVPAPVEAKAVKVLVRLDLITGADQSDLEKLRNKLLEVPYVEWVQTDFFDCLVRGEFKDNQFHLRLINPTGDGEKIQPSGNIDDLIKRITPYLEYTCLLKKLARVSNPHSPFKVNLRMKEKGRRDFKVGEKARFLVSTDKDCYLIMLNLDSQGSMRILFPNRYFQNNFIKAGQVIKIPDEKMGRKFELEFGEPVGEEVVKVIASTKPLKIEDLGLAGLDVERFGPKGLIAVPDNKRGILVKKVEEIPAEKMVWSEDMIVIRTHR